MTWDRRLWGVMLRCGRKDKRPYLLGILWADSSAPRYDGEPLRKLLFTTRDHARSWCDVENAKYAGRNDTCKDWHFYPVRVRERVEVVK